MMRGVAYCMPVMVRGGAYCMPVMMREGPIVVRWEEPIVC